MALNRRQLFSPFPFHHFMFNRVPKFHNWLKYFWDEIFAICWNYCRSLFIFLYRKPVGGGNLFDLRLLEHRLLAFSWNYADAERRIPFAGNQKGVHCGFFVEKVNFFWIVANCNWTVNRATREWEKVECALAVAAEGAENSDECRGGNLPKFQWNFFSFGSRSAIKCQQCRCWRAKEAVKIILISSIQLCISLILLLLLSTNCISYSSLFTILLCILRRDSK